MNKKPPETVPMLPKRNINSMYKHVKSRYLEKSRVEKLNRDKMKQCDLLKNKRVKSSLSLESDSEEISIDRTKYLTLIDKCFIEQLENDSHSGFISFILHMDNRRQIKDHTYRCGPSILSEPDLLITINDLLKESESPIDMLYAAFMVNRYKSQDTKEKVLQWFDPPEYNWLWLAEAIMITALVLNNRSRDDDVDSDDRPESAVFWYAAGVFYATNDCTEDAMDYLEKARTIADGPCRLKIPSVPSDLHLAMGVEQYGGFVKEPYSVWTLACLIQNYLLRKIAIHQNPEKALSTLQQAHRLLKESSEPDSIPRILNAQMQYELGLKYKAVGSTELAINAFRKCARFAKNIHRELDLEAKIMVAEMDPNLPDNWSLPKLKREAKKRLNFRLLVKTIVIQGMIANKKELFKEGFHHFAVAEWLSRKTRKQNADALDKELALFYMAICRTERLFRMFPITKKFEPRYLVNELNQWMNPEEKQMHCKAKKEARKLHNLFKNALNDSDEEDAYSSDNDKFSSDHDKFSSDGEQLSDEDDQSSDCGVQLFVENDEHFTDGGMQVEDDTQRSINDMQFLSVDKHFSVNFQVSN